MLEECLKKRIIREFLKCYSNEKWNFVISNLLEIAILNLKVSFNTLFFTDDDFNSILDDLKHNYNEINKKNNYNDNFNNKNNLLIIGEMRKILMIMKFFVKIIKIILILILIIIIIIIIIIIKEKNIMNI